LGTKSRTEWFEQAAVVGGAKPPVGAIVGGIFGVIGVIVIAVIAYVLLRNRGSGHYDPKGDADESGERYEVEFGGDNFEPTTLVTFHDETTTIAGGEQTVFATDAPETMGGDLVSLMCV
jgi:hypothetical protein